MLEGLLELLEKVVPGSEDDSSAIDDVLPEGFGSGLGRSFSHVRESKGDFLRVVTVRGLVDREVELDGIYPGDT